MKLSQTVVLIHGLWMTPRSWDRFRSRYEQQGFTVLAPAWPRMHGDVEDIRKDPSPLAGLGLAEVVDHYARVVRSLEAPPILIGHSIGGLTVQILLDRGLGAAGVAIAAPAPRGIYRLPLAVVRAGNPVLSNPFNYSRTVMLTFKQFRYAFANGMTEPEAREAYDRDAIPGPGRPIFQMALANLNPRTPAKVDFGNGRRAPLLLLYGDDDHLAPAVLGRINYKKRRGARAVTEFRELPGRSHLIVAQRGWEEVADYALHWALNAQAAPPSTTRAPALAGRIES